MVMHDSRYAELRSGVLRAACVAALCSIISLAGASAQAQVTAQTLIGKAVSDDAQTQEVTGAINRFRDRDIDGCRAIQWLLLECGPDGGGEFLVAAGGRLDRHGPPGNAMGGNLVPRAPPVGVRRREGVGSGG